MQVHTTLKATAEAMIALGILAISVAPVVLAIELGEWLTSQEWPGWSVEDGLGLFGIERGETAETSAQRWLDVVLAVPLTLALFMVGVNLLIGGFKLGEWELQRGWQQQSTAPRFDARSVAGGKRSAVGLTELLVWMRARLRARRAEVRHEPDRALRHFARASDLRPLPPHDRVVAALLMLRLGRRDEAEAVLRKLARQFSDSSETERRYLEHYCRAVLAMIDADTATVLAHSREAHACCHALWLRERFPLPPTLAE